MDRDALAAFYRGYIVCLNARDWDRLGDFVAGEVRYGDEAIGLAGYRAMLEGDVAAIPDLRFRIALLAVDPPWIAVRLDFDCTPAGVLFGLNVDGRRVAFSENVFYRVEGGRIAEVLSVIDKAAVAAQL
ncbi:ester cyclase [Sagittula sp.]|uniref:ester cyclase n=1 Tax=Sagittula sp. TaxID=2038081 RepID=UPI0035163FDA